MFSTYAGGKQTHTPTMTLPFDPTSGFHDYRFDYASNSVSFYADGKLMKQWKGASRISPGICTSTRGIRRGSKARNPLRPKPSW